MKVDEIVEELRSMSNPKNVEGMARYGINPKNNLGISVTTLRNFAKKYEKDHGLAQQLWSTGIRDARMLGALIDEPKLVTEEQMESWVKDFDSWDICDHCCGHLFDKTQFAYRKAIEWSERKEEFVKRAGFALMAWLAVHDKKSEDLEFERFFSVMKREANDERNYVKKAVNWALRNVGKRNIPLNKEAIKTAEEIKEMDSKSAKWIASDAIRELTSGKVQERLKRKSMKKGI